MFNPIESYEEAGIEAAKAMSQGDISRKDSWTSHFRSMLKYENPDDKKLAQAKFDEAYKTQRNIRIRPFR